MMLRLEPLKQRRRLAGKLDLVPCKAGFTPRKKLVLLCHVLSQGSMALFIFGILLFLLALAGCAHYPSISEAQLTSGNARVFIRSLYCPVNGNVIAMGSTSDTQFQGVALYSPDRGATWRKASIEPAPADTQLRLVLMPARDGIPVLYASGYRNGLFSAEPGPWWASFDEGRTWRFAEPRLPLSKLRGLAFFYFPQIVVADTAGTLVSAVPESEGVFFMRSIDWGEHWDKRLLQMPRDYVSPVVSDGHGHLAFFGQSMARFPLVDDYIGQVYWSSDAGATWNQGSHPEGCSFLEHMGIYRSPSGKMIAFNSTGRKGGDTIIFHSDDEGRTWNMSSGRGDFGVIESLAGDKKGRIVAVTNFGKILLSDNGGSDWRDTGLPRKAYRFRDMPEQIIFAGEQIIVATVGNQIVRSSDGGDTWIVVDSGLPDLDYGFSALCSDGNGLIVATGHGMMTRSLDWGLTWQPGKME